MRLLNYSLNWKEKIKKMIIEKENFLISVEGFNYKESYILMSYINYILTSLYGAEVNNRIEGLPVGPASKFTAVYVIGKGPYKEIHTPEVILIRGKLALDFLKSIDIPLITLDRGELYETIV